MPAALQRLMDLQTMGSVASIAGFLISLVGFSLAIYQASAARREAAKANRVARAVLRRLLAANASTAHWLARDFSRSCDERQWAEAAYKIQHLHQVLARLEANETLGPKSRDVIAFAVDDLNQISEHLHSRISASLPDSALPKQSRKKLAELIRFLTSLEAKIQTPNIGDDNEFNKL